MGAVAIEPTPVKTKVSRQRVRNGWGRAVRLSREVFSALQQKQVLFSVVLIGVLLVSALGVVIAAHENREHFNRLSELQAQRDQYQREWSQLLLEQSALSAHGRVEQLAGEQFGMTVPGKQDVVLVPLSAPMVSSR